MRISDWSSDVCSSDLGVDARRDLGKLGVARALPVVADPARNLAVDAAEALRKPGVPRDEGRGRDCAQPLEGKLHLSRQSAAHLHRAVRHFGRSEEHTSELQSLMRISYAVFCLKKQKNNTKQHKTNQEHTNS